MTRRTGYWFTAGVTAAVLSFSWTAVSCGDDFERAVDPDRFRKGNPDWDTQEMIAAGFTSLHEEHVKILKEIEELKTAVSRLEKKR